jgi:RNA polymerase sigma factor (sigma-70 family)
MVRDMINGIELEIGINTGLSAEELLTHADWVKRLARILTRDSSDAEDLVQETWLAAVKHPPATDRPLLPWLSEVTRNAFRMRRRGERRRAEREQIALALTEPPATPAELVERARLQQMLVALVLELPEAVRDVLLLRFFEDLTSGEIAQRLGVPDGTVRWRLKEGLEKLRERLDATHGGDRKAWCAAVVAGFRLPDLPVQGVPPNSPLPVSHNATWIALGLVLTVLGGAFYWQHRRESRGPHLAEHAMRMRDRIALEPMASPDNTALVEALGSVSIVGRVVDENGAPIVGAVVAVIRDTEVAEFGPPRPVKTSTTGPEGEFRIEDLIPGDYGLTAAADGHAPVHQLIHLVDESLENVVLRLGDDRLDASGSVEDAGGGVIPFASVEVSLENSTSASAVFVTTADGDGRFRIGVPRRDVVLVARSHGYVAEQRELQAGRREGSAEVSFRLIPAGSISGRVVDADDQGVAGAEVVFSEAGSGFLADGTTTTGPDGSFEFNDLVPGEYLVRARSGPLSGKQLVPVAVLAAMRAEGVVVRISEGLSVQGLVRDAEGRPFGPAVIVIAETEFVPGRPIARAAADGTFRIDGLLPGSYRLEAVKPGFFAETARVTVARDLEAPPAEIVMRRLGIVRGRVIDAQGKPLAGANVSVRWQDEKPQSSVSRKRTTVSDETGKFELTGVPPVGVTVRARHVSTEPAEGVVRLHADASRTAEIEVRVAGSGGTVSGAVRWPDGTPASGVFIWADGLDAVTDQQGFYRVGYFEQTGKVVVSASRRDRWLVHPGVGTPSQQEVEVGPDRQLEGIDLVASPADMSIGGVVTAPDGKPAAAVVIEAQLDFGPDRAGSIVSIGGSLSVQTLSAPDGSWRIENLEAGVYTLTASMPGSPGIHHRKVAAGTNGVNFNFKSGARVAGVVTATDGSIPSGCTVHVAVSPFAEIADVPVRNRKEHPDVFFDRSRVQVVEVDESTGVFEANGLAPGIYAIVAGCQQGGSGRLRGVTLDSGQNLGGLKIAVEEGLTVSGQIVEDSDGRPVAGATVSVSSSPETVRGQTNAQGRFELLNVARGGPAWLMVHVEGACSLPVERIVVSPPADARTFDSGVIRIAPLHVPCDGTGVGIFSNAYVRGTFVESVRRGSPAAQAGIVFGDRILEINGRDVTGLGPMAVDHLLRGAPGSQVSLTVWSPAEDRRRSIDLLREGK